MVVHTPTTHVAVGEVGRAKPWPSTRATINRRGGCPTEVSAALLRACVEPCEGRSPILGFSGGKELTQARRHRMSSIILNGDTFHGTCVFGRGVLTGDKYGTTYAGQCKDGYACGLGVITWSGVYKDYAEHGPDGQCDGRYLRRWTEGDADYFLLEHGKGKESAWVFADGICDYNGEACAPDDPRVLALIAHVAPVEVRPAVPAPHPQSPPTRLQAIVRCAGLFCAVRRWRPPWPPRCTTAPHAVANGRAA
jgi:hypothetical protein